MAAKTSSKPVSDAELDERDACALVDAAERAVKALESLRSRMNKQRDATSATGHLLEALAAAGGSIREYDRRHVWALRHALGGESFIFAASHDAAAQVLSTIIQALRPAQTEDEAARQKTAQADMLALATILQGSEHQFEARKNLEDADAGAARAKAIADKAAHDKRLAVGPPIAVKVEPPPKAPAPKTGISTAPQPSFEGDYVEEGSADGPGGNPFPTTPVG